MGQKRNTDLDAAGTLTGNELVEVSQLSTTVTYTATTISAQASDNSINDSAAQFIAEGFAVNDRVQIVGFTGDVANNKIVRTITALTAGKMTFGGTDGDDIVDDAAGESVTVTKWTSRRALASAIASAVATTNEPVTILVSDPNGSAITTGDGKAYFRVPSTLNGRNLVAVAAALTTTSSSGVPTVQIANVTQGADMLSTKLTIDAGDTDSSAAATPAVIDTGNDDVATGDMLRIDIDVAGTGAKGLIVEMQFA
jgi:hypothetical protein